jgi:hypothetical protein
MPDTAKELGALLGFAENRAASSAPWGQEFASGHKVSVAKVLFPRIETEPKK